MKHKHQFMALLTIACICSTTFAQQGNGIGNFGNLLKKIDETAKQLKGVMEALPSSPGGQGNDEYQQPNSAAPGPTVNRRTPPSQPSSSQASEDYESSGTFAIAPKDTRPRGTQTVEVEGFGADSLTAKQDAGKNAIVKVVGSLIQNKTSLTKNSETLTNGAVQRSKSISAETREYSKGSIQKMEVLETEKTANGLIRVRALVVVRVDDLTPLVEEVSANEVKIDSGVFAQSLQNNNNQRDRIKIVTELISAVNSGDKVQFVFKRAPIQPLITLMDLNKGIVDQGATFQLTSQGSDLNDYYAVQFASAIKTEYLVDMRRTLGDVANKTGVTNSLNPQHQIRYNDKTSMVRFFSKDFTNRGNEGINYFDLDLSGFSKTFTDSSSANDMKFVFLDNAGREVLVKLWKSGVVSRRAGDILLLNRANDDYQRFPGQVIPFKLCTFHTDCESNITQSNNSFTISEKKEFIALVKIPSEFLSQISTLKISKASL